MIDVACDSCDVKVIQGFICHEFGCPNRTYVNECVNCGGNFETLEKFNTVCSDECEQDLGW